MAKKRLDVRVEAEIRDGVELEAQRTGHSLSAIVERYVRDGLAKDHGELIEANSLPEVRAAVREEVAKSMSEAYLQLERNLDRMTHRNDERLVKLILRAARYAGHSQHMVHAFLAKQFGRELADRILVAAKEVVGKEIAHRGEQGADKSQ
jgi:flagellar biosynthesis/type III secretory pathway protein FliH